MSQAPRVLITGRHGFTGQYVAAEMAAAGWEVWGLGVRAPSVSDARYFQVDLTDSAGLEQVIATVKPDAVIHLAAIAFVAHGTAEDFYHVNVIGTRVLLDVLAKAGVGQSGVILASSANTYGNAVNDYAVSKVAMEYVAGLFVDRLPITITRPFNYTGHGQAIHFLIPKIVSFFRDRAPEIELGNIDVARDFSDVRDVARVYRGLLQSPPPSGVINICSGKATSLKEVLQMCRVITGHTMSVTINPAFVRANEVLTLMGDATLCHGVVPPQERRTLEETLTWMLEAPAHDQVS